VVVVVYHDHQPGFCWYMTAWKGDHVTCQAMGNVDWRCEDHVTRVEET
jgi:hypothetical protein